MTQVNLLPSDVRERQKSRRLLAAVVTGVGAVVALLFFVFMLQSARLVSANHKLAAQEAQNQSLQAKINSLQQFAQLKAEVALRQTLMATALQNQVRWSGVLRDISMVIPNKMWLTNLTGTVTDPTVLGSSGAAPAPAAPGTGSAPEVAPQTLVGSITFNGMATDNPTIALWLSRLVRVDGWENSWITSAQKVATVDLTSQKVQFNGSVDLTYEATVQGSKK